MKHGVVQHDDAGLFEGRSIDGGVKVVVAEVVEVDVGRVRVRSRRSCRIAKGGEQFGGVVRDAGTRGRQWARRTRRSRAFSAFRTARCRRGCGWRLPRSRPRNRATCPSTGRRVRARRRVRGVGGSRGAKARGRRTRAAWSSVRAGGGSGRRGWLRSQRAARRGRRRAWPPRARA